MVGSAHPTTDGPVGVRGPDRFGPQEKKRAGLLRNYFSRAAGDQV